MSDTATYRESPILGDQIKFGMSLAIFLFASLLFVVARPARAQDIPSSWFLKAGFTVRQWTSRDGLPVEGVMSLHQDEDGFIWAATLAGLVRFDGNRFRVFEASEFPELPNNRLVGLDRLPEGFFLLHTETGDAVYFDGEIFVNLSRQFGLSKTHGYGRSSDNKLLLFSDAGMFKIKKGPEVELLQKTAITGYGAINDSLGRTWIGSSTGLHILQPNGTIESFTKEDGLPSDDVRSIVLESDGSAIVSTFQGVSRYKDGRFTSIYLRDHPGSPYLSLHLAQFGNQALVSTSDGWKRVEGNTLVESFSKGTFPTTDIELISPIPAIDRAGNFWFAYAGRVYRNGELVLETEGSVRKLIADRHDGIWIAHNSNGLMKLSSVGVRVLGREEGLPGENSYGLLDDELGRMWVGLLDAEVFARYTNDDTDLTIPMGQPWAIGKDADGSIWLGGERLCKITGNTCIEDPLPDPYAIVRSIFFDSSDRFWVGTQSGVWMRKPDGSEWTLFEFADVSLTWVRAFQEGEDGTVYLGSVGAGLGIFSDNKLSHWNTENGFTSDNIRAIYQEEQNELWIGSEDHGLIHAKWSPGEDIRSARLTVIDKSVGLPDNSVHHIISDGKGKIWINSNRGVYCIAFDDLADFVSGRTATISLILFDERNGLRNREGNGGIQSGGYIDSVGRIRFPTQEGVAVFDPNATVTSPLPKVIPESFRVGTQRYLFGRNAGISLASDQLDARIEFSAPYFSKPEDLVFRYRLLGYSENWVDIGSEPTIVLTNIRSGHFNLEIQAGANGIWNENSTIISVNRTPAFAETVWFIIALLAFGLSTGGLLIYGRNRMIRRKNEELERTVSERTRTIKEQAERLATLDDMKTQFFTNISHELRTPLTLIKAPVSDLLAGAYGEPSDLVKRRMSTVERSVTRLLKLVNQILDLSALEAGAAELKSPRGDIGLFIKKQAEEFSTAASTRGINFDIIVPKAPVMFDFDPDKLELVVANLIGNALKFTGKGGSVSVALEAPSDDMITIRVADTGTGIEAVDLPHVFDRFYQGSSEHGLVGTGIGLAVSKELVHLHGGTIEVESAPGQGSMFTVTLPKLDTSAGQRTEALKPSSASVLKSSESAVQPEEDRASSKNGSERNTVLVAEDNEELLTFLSESLADSYEVISAENGRIALEQCREYVPDLVITDVMMPEMDGIALCGELKKDYVTCHIPIIMLTARADMSSKTSGLETGADVYLSKPFETVELKAYMKSLLQNRERVRTSLTRAASGDSVKSPEKTELAITIGALSSMDELFLTRMQSHIKSNLSDSQFSVESLADEMNLSTRQFLRKVEALTGERPSELLRRIRLEVAAKMIESRSASLKEISYATGFGSESGFRKAFSKRYGVPPSAWSAK